MNRPTGLLVAAAGAMLLISPTVSAQQWTVDWSTIDGGGEILSETGDSQWQLSGTTGQPDATESVGLTGSAWSLTGGFWPVNVEQTDVLFRDGFEGSATVVSAG